MDFVFYIQHSWWDIWYFYKYIPKHWVCKGTEKEFAGGIMARMRSGQDGHLPGWFLSRKENPKVRIGTKQRSESWSKTIHIKMQKTAARGKSQAAGYWKEV